MVGLKMNGVPVVMDVATILRLEFVCSLADDLGDLVRAFPYRPELAYSYIFRVLKDSA